MAPTEAIENRTFDEVAVGDTASSSRVLSNEIFALITALIRNVTPLDVPVVPASRASWSPVAEQAVWAETLVAELLNTKLPGLGVAFVAQSLNFHKTIRVGDTLTTRVRVTEKRPATRTVLLACECVDGTGDKVLSGVAEVIAPTEKIIAQCEPAPGIKAARHAKYQQLIARCRDLPPVATAVAYPCDKYALTAVADAAHARLITPLLVGPADRIRRTAASAGVALENYEVFDVPDPEAAAEKAVELVRTGKAKLIMKGSLHTDELMRAVVRKDGGLRTQRRISHCFIMDVPTYPKPLVITDAAINIFPTLEDKVDIVQNAIDLVHVFGMDRPRVAILSAVETINDKIQSTVDAAALCKMADRGQITGAVLDGPLALDNAINKEAARIKGITSPVAGEADILVVPDLEAGNMLAKNLTFLADSDAAGIVLGARVPVILTSRADSVIARMASCAVATLYVRYRETSTSLAS